MTGGSLDPVDREKAQLRKKLKEIRAQVDPALAEAASQGVRSALVSLPEFRKSAGLAGFASIPGEINTYPILESALSLGKKLYLPRISADKGRFHYFPVENFKTLEKGPFGIPEPAGRHPAPWEAIDLVLVPGLAFDRSGNRLGFGLGFYDQALPLLKKSCLTIGLAYSFQVVENVPVGPRDVPVRALLTEKGFQACRK